MESNASEIEQRAVPAFGYELLRYELLQDLLGDDRRDILYWAGRKLARRYPCESMEEIIRFFDHAGWGKLALKEEKRKEMLFELTPGAIQPRKITSKDTPDIALESGFLAEQVQIMKNYVTESYIPAKVDKKSFIRFIVRWDEKDSLD